VTQLVPLAQSSEYDAEEHVTPGRLCERTRIRQQWRDSGLTARRVPAVDEVRERVQAHVLNEGHSERKPAGIEPAPAPKFVKRQPEDGTVHDVDRQSGDAPARPARHRFAEEGHVGVAAA
jgi:hypothetical protein